MFLAAANSRWRLGIAHCCELPVAVGRRLLPVIKILQKAKFNVQEFQTNSSSLLMGEARWGWKIQADHPPLVPPVKEGKICICKLPKAKFNYEQTVTHAFPLFKLTL
ncbi:MAG TPA: hypothetical protein ACFYEK_13895 [Candidatus Wunengus sp. YC60]|uniref:hypothetical protein n=1 Tax=Candidatus Wunengus sp. YC60 TaxID=3367697 RepID=UPI004027FB7B